jgi:hypothetical protein
MSRSGVAKSEIALEEWRVANPFAFFLLTTDHNWMIPLQYMIAELRF